MAEVTQDPAEGSSTTPGGPKPRVRKAAPAASAAPVATVEAQPINADEHPALVRRRGATGVVIAALAVGALVGGVSGAGVTLLATSHAIQPVVGNPTAQTITVNDPAHATPITAVVAKAAPSVVTINVTAPSEGGTGSGVVLSNDGYILTNTHVVTLDGAAADATVSVTTYDGRLFSAKVIGTDPISDLAVIKVEGADLPPATFADSSKLNVGDTAIAIGAPLGLSNTVTDGIVSALNRSITIASSAAPKQNDGTDPTPDQGGQGPYDFWNFDLGQGQGQPQTQAPASSSATISLAVIQTDAAINPGNSGGALLDSDGNVIGINVAIASSGSSTAGQSGSIGVGFAIPSNIAQRVSKEIIASGTATHGLLGASVADVTEDANQKASKVVGASIVEISAGGAAADAGMKVGDVITNFNGIPVTGKTDLTAEVRAVAAGSKGTVTYVREGKASTVDVTLGTLK
ncbi:MAG: trypsin-like peptidase domain-containing protein [Rhodoglobus sp.]